MARVEEIALRMEDLAAQAGLPRFDRVGYDTGADEVWFYWEDQKLAVVVELTSGPDELGSALAAATAQSGDAVLS